MPVLCAMIWLASCGGTASDGDGEAGTDGFEPLIVDLDTDAEVRVFCGTVEFEGRSIDLTSYPVFEGELSTYVTDQFRPEFDLQWEEGLKDETLHELERSADRLHLFGETSAPEGGRRYREIAFERKQRRVENRGMGRLQPSTGRRRGIFDQRTLT